MHYSRLIARAGAIKTSTLDINNIIILDAQDFNNALQRSSLFSMQPQFTSIFSSLNTCFTPVVRRAHHLQHWRSAMLGHNGKQKLLNRKTDQPHQMINCTAALLWPNSSSSMIICHQKNMSDHLIIY